MKGDRVSDIDYVQENDLLLFVLHQLISITSISSENKYDRIFVTTYVVLNLLNKIIIINLFYCL